MIDNVAYYMSDEMLNKQYKSKSHKSQFKSANANANVRDRNPNRTYYFAVSIYPMIFHALNLTHAF